MSECYFDVHDQTRQFIEQNGISIKKKWFETKQKYSKRRVAVEAESWNLMNLIDNSTDLAKKTIQLSQEILELQKRFGTNSLHFLLPTPPISYNLKEWQKYSYIVNSYYQNAAKFKAKQSKKCLDKIFSDAVENMPEGKAVIIIKDDFVPDQENLEFFNEIIQNIIYEYNSLGLGLNNAWLAFNLANTSSEEIQELKDSFKGNLTHIKVSYA